MGLCGNLATVKNLRYTVSYNTILDHTIKITRLLSFIIVKITFGGPNQCVQCISQKIILGDTATCKTKQMILILMYKSNLTV